VRCSDDRRIVVPNSFELRRDGVHPQSNTEIESWFDRNRRLDKIAFAQHAVPAHLESYRGRTGLTMKIVTGLLAAVLFLAGIGASHAMMRISEDRGGRIGTYLDKYQSLRSSGETVAIDGLCASACTIVLGAIPADRICVTSRANLGFHAAWDRDSDGRPVTNAEATRMLYSMYPAQIKRWIKHRGGLKPQMIFLHGRQLTSMYRPCYLDAQASVH
jgi:hypothetical protein